MSVVMVRETGRECKQLAVKPIVCLGLTELAESVLT